MTKGKILRQKTKSRAVAEDVLSVRQSIRRAEKKKQLSKSFRRAESEPVVVMGMLPTEESDLAPETSIPPSPPAWSSLEPIEVIDLTADDSDFDVEPPVYYSEGWDW